MANSVIQTIRDAEVDARSLSEFVSKGASFTVTRRLAPTIHTLDYYLLVLNNVKEKGNLADIAISDTLDKLEQLEPTVIQRVEDAINNTAVEGGVLADTFVVVDGSLSQRTINKGLESIADLSTIKNPKDGLRVYVKSYHAGLGKGGGYFTYGSSRASENDGGSVLNGWVRDISGENITPFMFGARADGVSDDAQALERAFTSKLASASVVSVPDGDYAVKAPVTVSNSVSVVFSKSSRLLVFGYAYLSFGGSLEQIGTLSSSVSKGSLSLPISGSTAAVKAGDMLGVWDNTDNSLSNTLPHYWKGEFLTAESVTGSSIRASSRLLDSYEPTKTKVFLFNPTSVSLIGINLVSAEKTDRQAMLIIDKCRDVVLTNPVVIGSGASAVAVRRTLNATITGGNIQKEMTGGSATGREYGLSISNCQSVSVIGGVYRSYRHAITIGSSGSYECAIANRDIVVRDVNATSTLDTIGSLDAHGNTAQAKFINCTTRGMWLGGGDISVLGCKIYSDDSITGGVIRSQGFYGGTFTMRDTEIESNLQDTSSAQLVVIETRASSAKSNLDIILENITINGTTSGANIVVFSVDGFLGSDETKKINLYSNNINCNLASCRAVVSFFNSGDSEPIYSDYIHAGSFLVTM